MPSQEVKFLGMVFLGQNNLIFGLSKILVTHHLEILATAKQGLMDAK